MSSAELEQWMAYYALEPFGAERDNLHAAMIASLLANIHRPKNKTPYSTNDFMLRTDEDRKERQLKKQISFLDALSNAHSK